MWRRARTWGWSSFESAYRWFARQTVSSLARFTSGESALSTLTRLAEGHAIVIASDLDNPRQRLPHVCAFVHEAVHYLADVNNTSELPGG